MVTSGQRDQEHGVRDDRSQDVPVEAGRDPEHHEPEGGDDRRQKEGRDAEPEQDAPQKTAARPDIECERQRDGYGEKAGKHGDDRRVGQGPGPVALGEELVIPPQGEVPPAGRGDASAG